MKDLQTVLDFNELKRREILAGQCLNIAGHIFAARYADDTQLFSSDRLTRRASAEVIYEGAEALFNAGIKMGFSNWPKQSLSVTNTQAENAPHTPAPQ